ncbi:MAG TPA: tRNA (adenosine(37)-N6)-threonylcarbamoyltransferase complex dimerization subunit type 1 TsaB [Candidatus Limnocylindrales bacterium]|nr:tRNA (adenosine(37)-N6)-threonylcarbamoyltransferase complex dimerization subunit type 1 TsaB [Candidatus Limnocylindrales bacterium]
MIIAIDGASTDLSLAVAEPNGTLLGEDAWSSVQRQSAELLPHLLALLERVERPLRETTVVAVGTGPGSFTGLRVAMALAKGIAVGLHIPIVGVPSLDAWLDADSAAVAAVARAGAREAYLLERGDAEPRVVDREELPLAAPVVAATELAAAFGLVDARRPRGAVAIASHAAARISADAAGDDLRTLEPLYLRAPRGVTAESGERVRWL